MKKPGLAALERGARPTACADCGKKAKTSAAAIASDRIPPNCAQYRPIHVVAVGTEAGAQVFFDAD